MTTTDDEEDFSFCEIRPCTIYRLAECFGEINHRCQKRPGDVVATVMNARKGVQLIQRSKLCA